MGSGDGVNIPVRVTGADAAKADIKGVGDAADQASEKQRRAQQREEAIAARRLKAQQAKYDREQDDLAFKEFIRQRNLEQEALRGSGDALDDFGRKGEKALKSALRVINPELAAMADLTLDVAQGFGQMSSGLLAVGGAGAVLGVVIALFEQLQKKAEEVSKKLLELQELREKERSDALSLEERVAQKFEKAGRFTNFNAAAIEVAGLGKKGIPEDAATFGVLGAQLGNLSEEERAQLIRGFIAGGGRDEFTGNKGDDARTLARVLNRGGTPEAAIAAGRHVDTFGESARRSAAGIPKERFSEQAIETALDEQVRDIGITPGEKAAIREGAREYLRSHDAEGFGPTFKAIGDVFNNVSDGGRRNTFQLAILAEQVALAAQRQPTQGSVTINVTNNGVVNNTTRQFSPSPEVIDKGSR